MRSGIKSIEVGGRLIDALVHANAPLSLKDLAARARLSPSAAHRYLVSYQRLGLVCQDADTHAYDIGSFAVELGVSAIGRSRLLTHAQELLRSVRDRLDESVMLAVWGSYGPVIIAVEESSKPVVMTMRVGATLPLFRTATGWIFAAFMPRTVVKPLMRKEIAADRGPVQQLDETLLEQKLESIRAARLASHSGHLLPGVTATATPLLDSRGTLFAAMSVFGNSENFDASPNGDAATILKQVSHAIGKGLPDRSGPAPSRKPSR